jgi:hypothetical protein
MRASSTPAPVHAALDPAQQLLALVSHILRRERERDHAVAPAAVAVELVGPCVPVCQSL